MKPFWLHHTLQYSPQALAWMWLPSITLRVPLKNGHNFGLLESHEEGDHWGILYSPTFPIGLHLESKQTTGTNSDSTSVRKTLKLKFLFFFIYFCPVEPKCDPKHSQTDRGNNNSHACKYSIVYVPVHVHPHSMIKYSTIYVT